MEKTPYERNFKNQNAVKDLLLIFVSALLKSFADTLDHHFEKSKFSRWPRKWFDPNVIHKTAPTIFNYPIDAWHISNSLQLCCWLLLPICYEQHTPWWWLDCVLGGTWFVIVFNFFYNKIFLRRKP